MRAVAIAAAFALGVCLFVPSLARADLMWTLSDVTFGDGGTEAGWFGTDAITGDVTNFDITTNGGSSKIGPNIYTPANSTEFPYSPGNFSITSTINGDFVAFYFFTPLTGTPDVLPLYPPSYEYDATYGYRSIISGQASLVPEPTALTILTVGLAALGLARRRQGVKPRPLSPA